jgi:hypothetical protein
MRSTEYLYGEDFDSSLLSTMVYTDALLYKVNHAKALIALLCTASVGETDWVRIQRVAKAIDFNEVLLAEARGAIFEV